MDAWTHTSGGGTEVFAPDLIGCGRSDPWIPEQKGLSIPLDWSRAIEKLWREHIRRPCVVVVQGDLASIGVRLAGRLGERAVCGLVLVSPPSWSTMAQRLTIEELSRKSELLASPLGDLLYTLLRQRVFMQLLSDQFLFAADTDALWLDLACNEAATEHSKWPCVAVNAGLHLARSYAEELQDLHQPVLLLEGNASFLFGTNIDRESYVIEMRRCMILQLSGLNALPWESPRETAKAIAAFAYNEIMSGKEYRCSSCGLSVG